MKIEKPVRAAPGRTHFPGILLGAFVLLAIVFASALFAWAAPWTIPRAATPASGGYELATYWDGAEVSGGKFDRPNGIAVAPDGDVYVVDARKRVVRLDASGRFKAEWGREGNGAGEFSNPMDVAVAPDGSVFVSDYKFNTRANHFRFGDTFTHNAAFQYRLWPQTLPDTGVPAFVYGVLELNGVRAQRSEQNVGKLGDSGGYTLFLSPGLQYVTQRWVAEISVQLPVVQELNGSQLKTDYILSAGFRVQF